MAKTPTAIQSIDGPLPGIGQWPEGHRVTANKDVGAAGHLEFWVLIETTEQSGPGIERKSTQLVDGDIEVRLIVEPRFINLLLQGGPNNPMHSLRLLTPGLPGPGWYHLVFEWDAAGGYVNTYVNGTRIRQSDESIGKWQPPAITELRVATENFRFADVKLKPGRISPAALQETITQFYYGNTDLLLGARPLGTLDVNAYRGELIYQNPFSSENDVAEWIMEGDAVLQFDDGWMTMASQRPDGEPEHGHFVFWNPLVLPDSFVAEWEFQPINIHGLCIVFFAAKGIHGESIFAENITPREGSFQLYHSGDINSYHISYFANTPNEPGRATSNLRKNSGFYLVANGPPGVPSGSLAAHHMSLVKIGNHIRMAVDGNLIIDWVDDGSRYGPALGEGVLGLRQMQWTVGRYRNFRVFSTVE